MPQSCWRWCGKRSGFLCSSEPLENRLTIFPMLKSKLTPSLYKAQESTDTVKEHLLSFPVTTPLSCTHLHHNIPSEATMDSHHQLSITVASVSHQRQQRRKLTPVTTFVHSLSCIRLTPKRRTKSSQQRLREDEKRKYLGTPAAKPLRLRFTLLPVRRSVSKKKKKICSMAS